MSEKKKGGLLPSPEEQAVIIGTYSYLAHKYAKRQAEQGVEEYYAADHGQKQAAAVLYFVLFAVPWAGLNGLVGLAYPPYLLVAAPTLGVTTWLAVRLSNLMAQRGDTRAVYDVPTSWLVWALVLWGVVSLPLMLVIFVMKALS